MCTAPFGGIRVCKSTARHFLSSSGALFAAVCSRLQLKRAAGVGNMVRAWKECLDPESAGSIGFVDFARATRQFGFNGPIKEIWDQLDDDNSGVISFDEVTESARACNDYSSSQVL